MARGSTQSQGRAARSEVYRDFERPPRTTPAPVSGEVDFGIKEEKAVYVPIYVVAEIQQKENRTKDAIADAQNVLAKQDRADLVRALGGEDNAAKILKQFEESGLSKDLLKPRGVIDRQASFNRQLKEAGDVPLAKNDPILLRAVSNYFEAQKIGKNPTYEMLGANGNGYAKTKSFEPVYNKELKAWELVRYGNPLLNSDDPKDFYTEKGWFAVKGSPNNKTLETKLKKVAIVMNTFIED